MSSESADDRMVVRCDDFPNYGCGFLVPDIHAEFGDAADIALEMSIADEEDTLDGVFGAQYVAPAAGLMAVKRPDPDVRRRLLLSLHGQPDAAQQDAHDQGPHFQETLSQ
jgi:hypothetical protein